MHQTATQPSLEYFRCTFPFLSLFFFFRACSFPGPCETQPRGFRAEGCWSFLMWIAELISHYGVLFNKCARTWKRSGLIQIWLWGYVMLEVFRWEYRSRSCSHIWCRGSVEGEEINHLRFFFIKMFILTRFHIKVSPPAAFTLFWVRSDKKGAAFLSFLPISDMLKCYILCLSEQISHIIATWWKKPNLIKYVVSNFCFLARCEGFLLNCSLYNFAWGLVNEPWMKQTDYR